MKDNNKTLEFTERANKYLKFLNDHDVEAVHLDSIAGRLAIMEVEAIKQREDEILAALPKIKKPKRFKPGEIMTSDILISIGLYEAIAEIKQIITKQK